MDCLKLSQIFFFFNHLLLLDNTIWQMSDMSGWLAGFSPHGLSSNVKWGLKLFVCIYFVEMAKRNLCFSWSFRDWSVFHPKFFSLWQSFLCDISASSDILFQSFICRRPQRKRLLQEDFSHLNVSREREKFRSVNEHREALPASSV